MAFRAEDIPAANRHFMKVKQYADALVETSAGKHVLEALTQSPLPFVRLRAARRVLNWDPGMAIPVLGRLLVETFDPEISVDERLELKLGARHCLFEFFGVKNFDRNALIEPLKGYGVDLPYQDHRKWE